MALTSDGRQKMSTYREEEQMAKRPASGQWVASGDVPQSYGAPVHSQNWMGPSGHIPTPPAPPAAPMAMPSTQAVEAYNPPVNQGFSPNHGYQQHIVVPPSQLVTHIKDNLPLANDRKKNVLGTYPVEIPTPRNHLTYEKFMINEPLDRITEKDHFSNFISLLECLFKGVIGPSARSKVMKMVQTAMHNPDTSVEEGRRLKHVLESIRNSAPPVNRTNGPDDSYIWQLSSTYASFQEKFGKSGEVK